MTDHMGDLLSSFLVAALWRASWQGTLALLFVGVLCRVFARRLTADTHCWLWRLSYAKLLLGLVWSGALLVPLLSPALPPVPVAQSPAVFAAASQAPAQKMPMTNTESTLGAAVPVAIRADAKPKSFWQTYLAIAYGLGMAVCLGRLLLAARRTRRILESSVPDAAGPETVCALGLAQQIGLRRVPPLARSAEVDSPVLVAGTVLLPAGVQYDEASLRMILAHELAHVQRRDLLWEWLGTLVQVMFFFHPLVVLARREEWLAREAAADALALQTTEVPAADYGRLLLTLSLEQSRPRPLLVGVVGVIEGGTLLRRRLLALRDAASGTSARRKQWRIALTLVPLLALVFVPWKMTNGQAPPSAPPPASSTPAPIAPDYPTPTMPAGDKRITGIVSDEKGKPLVGLSVSLTWHWPEDHKNGSFMPGETTLKSISTDAQGRFAFAGLPAGDFDYDVRAQTESGASPKVDPYVPRQASLVIAKTDSQKTLDIVMTTGSLVTGRVVDGQTGKPMAGIFVGAGPIPPSGDLTKWTFWAMPSQTMTDTEGRYQVRVWPGEVFVGVGRFSDGRLLTRRIRYAAQRVTVKQGQTASAPDLPVLLHPMIVCVGPDGQPVVNAAFRVVPGATEKEQVTVQDQTDSTGAVVLDRFESGTFSTAQAGRTASGTFHWSPSQPLTITMDGQTKSYPSGVGTVTLEEGSAGLVTGTVVSETGTPIPGALIHIYEIDPKSRYGLGEHDFKADISGVFHGTLDPNGEYSISVRADGFNQVAVSEKPLAISKGSTTNLGSIRLMRADGSVSGRVVDSLGKPMSGVLAFVQGGKTYLSSSITDNQGHFHIPNVVADEALTLHLCLKGESPDSGTALAQSNEEMEFSGVKASPLERKIIWHPHS